MLTAPIETILLVTGLLTASALILSLAPVRMTTAIFGQPPADELSRAIIRHWGCLVFLIGALLVYSASHPEVRFPTLILAITEKVAFALTVLFSRFRQRPMALAMGLADAGMAAVYVAYLAGL